MQPIWTPSPERVAAARMTAFAEYVRGEHGVDVPDYESLWRWSVENRGAFWSGLWDHLAVIGQKGERAVADPDLMPGARWFPDARLSYAENLLAGWGDETAIVFVGEGRPARTVTRAELSRLVAGIAAGLRSAGVERGDRVAAFVPNLPEAVAGLLAANSIGAVWSSCSPDFGVQGVLDRFGQIEPKVLFTADGYRYGGREYDSLGRVAEIRAALGKTGHVVVIPYLSDRPRIGGIPGAVPLAEFASGGGDAPTCTRLPFAHPLAILFSSGTTGAPKCIVHGQGGALLQHLKEHALHTDVREGTRLFYYTTTGWMMWNWLVSGLASGATILLYDGSPTFPDPLALWRLAEEQQVEVFGTSAKYLAALEKAGAKPREEFGLPALRTILSTGSPLSVESFRYVYRDVKEDVCLSSISGGTDILSCFALGNPAGPVRPGELQCRGLGMDVHAFDPDGNEVVGERGELVCTRPFPAMPRGFWNDPDGRRYRAAYFSRYPGVWHHGDFVTVTESGGLVIHGRSDATLNPGGVRIGTAEIYRQVATFPEVLDSLVTAQRDGDDERILLFLKLREGEELTGELADRIRRRIREKTSPRHVPARVVAVRDIPYTRSGKKVEIAVRRLLAGEAVTNREALANPEALEEFRDRPELSG